MEGFFSDEEHRKIADSIRIVNACNRCGLYQHCLSPKMKGTGKGKYKILFIAEAPGETEDNLNTQLVGQDGKKLREILDQYFDVDLDDCRKFNAINCRPPKNRKPTQKEIEYCRRYVDEEIESFSPNVIVLMGEVAIRSYMLGRWKKDLGTEEVEGKSKGGIVSRWRGWSIPDTQVNAWVIPTFHPSYVMRMENTDSGEVIEKLFVDDLEKAFNLCDRKPNRTSLDSWKNGITVLTEPDEIIQNLKHLLECTDNDSKFFISFDYETTGLKPYAKGHDIISCSYSIDGNSAVSFPMHREVGQSDRIKTLWSSILCSDNPKIAHNMKFEEIWSRVILGITVNNWYYDTLLGAHVEDNRKGISGLKFQTFVKLGIPDYDSTIEPYLKSDDKKDSNAFNQIRTVMKNPALFHDLLVYNALDSLFTYRLAMQQRRLQRLESYQLLHKGTIALFDSEYNGIDIDVDHCSALIEHQTRRATRLEEKLKESEGGKLWRKRFGSKMTIKSFPQLGAVLEKDLGMFDLPRTDGGSVSVSEKSLEKIDHPIAKNIVEIRKILKVRDTYLVGYIREARESKVHPTTNLHTTVTFRPSMNNPNLANVPKRNEEAQRICRSIFLPKKDHIWLEVDYKAIEVKVAACVTKDPNLIEECTDPKRDMHRDMACEICKLEPDEWTDKIRFYAKNCFTFREFYGGFYKQCAEDLWDIFQRERLKTEKGIDLLDHLKKQDIPNYKKFEDHLEKVERRFWEERFAVYNQWKKDWYKEYLQNGEFSTVTGFTCRGYMDEKGVCNYPIQGPAFHCLLQAYCMIKERKEQMGLKSNPMFQIYDAIESSVHTDPEEFNGYIDLCLDVMINEIPKLYDWIIVPLEVSIECATMNEPWNKIRKVKPGNICKVCGAKYMYKKDLPNESTEWECVLCGEKEII